jgi:hypothetical protein
MVHYSAAILFSVIFCIGEYGQWNVPLGVVAGLALSSLAISFYWTLIRTGLLRLTRASAKKLDEREIQITHRSLRHSYAIFSVFSLALIGCMVISVRFSWFNLTHRGHYSFGLIVLIFLQYLVQTLPASIIAWTEERVVLRDPPTREGEMTV